MKRQVLATLVLPALLLTACNQTAAPPQRQPETPPAQAEPASAPAVTPESLGREACTTLTYNLEGEETAVPASIYIGDGWSLYVPDEGWVQSDDTVDEISVTSWTSDINDTVSLHILNLGGMNLEECQSWISNQFPDCTFIEEKQGCLGGMNDEQQCADARLISSDNGMYAILSRYPLEAAEGFAVTLSAIADSFQLDPA